jgi:hypothetical protein
MNNSAVLISVETTIKKLHNYRAEWYCTEERKIIDEVL